VKKILEAKAKIEIDIDYAGQAEARGYRASMDKTRARLGFMADRGVTVAVHEIWEAFERGRHLDFANPVYYNIDWMKKLPAW
jgi:hypothetical protein